ncbi:hypothetical protein [Salidesulfovibrio onnuriiensis]|uniref:hypothetical protein n=1 Tax=Salidesulfovibrio onnuriiensis TaxID=2583823 RepID=UPI00202BA4AC|nr:hypothetical protein [Salidesulfovibrio onnuriiensis]
MQRPQANITAIAWWLAYTVAAVWAQKLVPGIDFLAPGLVLSMQERPGWRTLALACFWCLLLEGMGNMAFGYAFIWYGLLALFYLAGQWLFEARSILFMCLLGAGLGVLHPVLIHSLATLQGMAWPLKRVIWEGVAQAASFPVVWLLAKRMLPKRLRQDDVYV